MDMDVGAAQSIEDYVSMHAVQKQDVSRLAQLGTCLRLRFLAGKLVQVLEVDEFEEDEIKIRPALKPLRWGNYPAHQLSFLVPTDESQAISSHLGGQPPADFVMPDSSDILSPFQYVGQIAKADAWESLPIPALHIVYPLFVTIPDYLFLDYSNPNQPQILDNFEVLEYPYGEWASGSVHQFQKVPVKGMPINEVEDEDEITFGDWHLGYAGVPNWAQYPKIPYCPKSGKLMQFVCQIDTFGKIETVESDLVFKGDYFEQYAKHLNFWGDGSLFVFIEPETKVVGYIIQNT